MKLLIVLFLCAIICGCIEENRVTKAPDNTTVLYLGNTNYKIEIYTNTTIEEFLQLCSNPTIRWGEYWRNNKRMISY